MNIKQQSTFSIPVLTALDRLLKGPFEKTPFVPNQSPEPTQAVKPEGNVYM